MVFFFIYFLFVCFVSFLFSCFGKQIHTFILFFFCQYLFCHEYVWEYNIFASGVTAFQGTWFDQMNEAAWADSKRREPSL